MFIRQVLDECRQLIQANVTDFDRFNKGESSLLAAIVARHVTAENNRRCVLAYLYQRLMRLKVMLINGYIYSRLSSLREGLADPSNE